MSEVGRMAMVVLGIGLVIFVHELGHFLAARLCRVRVDVFSLGFGPRLFGWRRGPTLYQVALLPLGGYVRMAGEEREDGRPPASDELHAKSVGQRFLIYSGGVLMNVIFAVVVFPILLATGVPMLQPVVGSVEPGGPAWHAGVPAGARVLEVNGHRVLGFLHIPPEVALGPSERTTLRVLEPGSSEPRTYEMVPEYSKAMGVYTIGIGAPLDPEHAVEVAPDSPFGRAGLRSGDRLLSVEGTPAGLALDEQLEFALARAEPMHLRYLRIERAADGRELSREERTALVSPEPPPSGARAALGLQAPLQRVADLRVTERVRQLGLEKDDRLVSVNGQPILREFDLWSALAVESSTLSLLVRRGTQTLRLESPAPPRAEIPALIGDIALGGDLESGRIVVRPHGAAADAGLLDGDRIVALAGRPIARFDELTPIVKQAKSGSALDVVVKREVDGVEKELGFSILPRVHPAIWGLQFEQANYVCQAESPTEAVVLGVSSSFKFLEESWLTLRRILTGQVSGDNVGGIITIGVVSHSWAGQGIAKLLFFLCMLSMNLAFLNVLPIPVLDGGHLFFLLIEKIKGSPVSERVLSYSQIVGIVLIVSLMVYVTFNDIQRWIIR